MAPERLNKGTIPLFDGLSNVFVKSLRIVGANQFLPAP
jgi:hypothetical protein